MSAAERIAAVEPPGGAESSCERGNPGKMAWRNSQKVCKTRWEFGVFSCSLQIPANTCIAVIAEPKGLRLSSSLDDPKKYRSWVLGDRENGIIFTR